MRMLAVVLGFVLVVWGFGEIATLSNSAHESVPTSVLYQGVCGGFDLHPVKAVLTGRYAEFNTYDITCSDGSVSPASVENP